MRPATAPNDQSVNDLRNPAEPLAAHWLHSDGVARHDLSPNDTPVDPNHVAYEATISHIASAWPHLQPHVREAILTLVVCGQSAATLDKQPSDRIHGDNHGGNT